MASRYRFSHLKVLLLSKKAELSLALSLLEIRESQSLAKQKANGKKKGRKESNREKKIHENKNR